MPDLIDKKPGIEAKPTTPETQRLDLRPQPASPPAPKPYRWIKWMVLLVVSATVAVLMAVLLTGGDTDPEVQAAPDALDRYLAARTQPATTPDALDRYLANN